MERVLSEALGTLQDEDGKPHLEARRANLAFLSNGGSLTNNEIRFLRDELSRCISIQSDFIRRFPVEILLILIEYLDASDILQCVAVSKTWYEKFGSEATCMALAQRFFPRAYYERKADDPRTRGDLFFRRVLRYMRKIRKSQNGKHDAEFVHKFQWADDTLFSVKPGTYEKYPPPNPNLDRRPLYAEGRIVWQAQEHCFVLDDLRSKTRTIFAIPDGPLLGAEARPGVLGNMLFVAFMDRFLFVWGIQTGRFEKLTLPNLPLTAMTTSDRLTVVTSTEVYLWRPGEQLRGLGWPEISSSPRLSDMQISDIPDPKLWWAFIHPHETTWHAFVFLRPEVLFLSDRSTQIRFFICEFQKRRWVKTHVARSPEVNWSHEKMVPLIQTSPYTYLTGFFKRDPSNPAKSQGYTIEFDVFQRKFSRWSYVVQRSGNENWTSSYQQKNINAWRNPENMSIITGTDSIQGCLNLHLEFTAEQYTVREFWPPGK